MLDALKPLFENDVLSEEVRVELEEAWNQKVKENKRQATAELREEFAQKYEHDKQVMVEAIDAMLSEKLQSEIAEFAEDRKQLAEAKAKYSVKMRENAELMQAFVLDQLGKEISELHEDQRATADRFARLEEFVVEALAKEIAEFYEDKKDLNETKVRLVKEAKTQLNNIKSSFIKKSAALVSETVDKTLKTEISQLKEDIDAARQNDFGRKLFEAFASEYTNSYLNEKSETAKLLKVVELKDKQLAEAKAFAVKAKQLAESTENEKRKLMETATRKEIISELTAPLNKAQREIMLDLLESVQTNKLNAQFEKYLPAVIDGKTPAKRQALNEGKEITGNRKQENSSKKADDSNVIDLRRLAGLN